MDTVEALVALYRAAMDMPLGGETLVFARKVESGGLVVLQEQEYESASQNYDWIGVLAFENMQELASLDDNELREYAARRSFLPGVAIERGAM